MSSPVVRMRCHKGATSALAVNRSGYQMASAGMDGRVKVWDIRQYKILHEIKLHTPIKHLSYSDNGLLAVSNGPHIQVNPN